MSFRKLILLLPILCIMYSQAQENCFTEPEPASCILQKINFSDTLINTATANLIADYISVFQDNTLSVQEQDKAFIAALAQLFEHASTNEHFYEYLFENTLNLFSVMGYFQVVDYVLSMPFLLNTVSDAALARMLLLAESFNKMRIGIQVPNIEATSVYQQPFSLYDLKSEYTILFFFSLNCEHCRETLYEMNGFLKKHTDYKLVMWMVRGKKNKLKRVMWRAHLKNNSVCLTDDLGWKSPVIKAYDVSSTPFLLILDADKNIVAKPFDMEDLRNFANQNN